MKREGYSSMMTVSRKMVRNKSAVISFSVFQLCWLIFHRTCEEEAE